MARCNPWFNSKTVSGIKLWNILSVRYYEREIQTYMFTLTDTLPPPPPPFAMKFSICEMSYYLQNKNRVFPAFFLSFFFHLLYVHVCFGFFFPFCILSQHSDWSPSLVAGNQAGIKHPWCFWSASAKLQIGNALLVAPPTKEILDVQFHPSSLSSHSQAAEMRQQQRQSMCLIVGVSDRHY